MVSYSTLIDATGHGHEYIDECITGATAKEIIKPGHIVTASAIVGGNNTALMTAANVIGQMAWRVANVKYPVEVSSTKLIDQNYAVGDTVRSFLPEHSQLVNIWVHNSTGGPIDMVQGVNLAVSSANAGEFEPVVPDATTVNGTIPFIIFNAVSQLPAGESIRTWCRFVE